MGYFTHAGFDEASPAQASGLEEPQSGAGAGTGIIICQRVEEWFQFAASPSKSSRNALMALSMN